MHNKLFSLAFTSLLLLASIFFFYQHIYIVAVILLVGSFLRINNFKTFQHAIHSMIHLSNIERNANLHLKLRINIEYVVTHPALQELFNKLPESSSTSFKEWGEVIVANFKTAANSEYALHSVSFNLKNSILFKNEKIYFLDSLYDEIFLPFAASDCGLAIDHDDIRKAISLRIVVVNGSLNLEAGRFSKELSPLIYSDGYLGKYQHYTRITSFPLLHTAFRYGLPSRYLNPIFKASQTYKDIFLTKNRRSKSVDWVKFKEDLATYETIVGDNKTTRATGAVIKNYQKSIGNFNTQATKLLEDEEFICIGEATESDADWLEDDGSVTYKNKYLTVEMVDWNAKLEHLKENLFPDYWEERAF